MNFDNIPEIYDYIKDDFQCFVGEKINLKEIVNEPIVVLDWKIGPSKLNSNGTCLTMQIYFNNEKRVVFTGASILQKQLKLFNEKSQLKSFRAKVCLIGKSYSFQYSDYSE